MNVKAIKSALMKILKKTMNYSGIKIITFNRKFRVTLEKKDDCEWMKGKKYICSYTI